MPLNRLNAFEETVPPKLDGTVPGAESMDSLIQLLSTAIAMRLRTAAAQDDDPAPMLTVAQAAHLLGISRMTVIRKADAGELPCVVVSCGKQKKMRRFPRKFIEDLALGKAHELPGRAYPP